MVAGLVVEFQPIMPQNHKFRQNQQFSSFLEQFRLTEPDNRHTHITYQFHT